MKRRMLSAVLALILALPMGVTALAAGSEPSASQKYVEAMGHGWNLGNSFEGIDTNEEAEDLGETAWGNPVVTRELIHEIKEKGVDSIRMPLTLFRRYTEKDGKAVIDTEWLARYKDGIEPRQYGG